MQAEEEMDREKRRKKSKREMDEGLTQMMTYI